VAVRFGRQARSNLEELAIRQAQALEARNGPQPTPRAVQVSLDTGTYDFTGSAVGSSIYDWSNTIATTGFITTGTLPTRDPTFANLRDIYQTIDPERNTDLYGELYPDHFMTATAPIRAEPRNNRREWVDAIGAVRAPPIDRRNLDHVTPTQWSRLIDGEEVTITGTTPAFATFGVTGAIGAGTGRNTVGRHEAFDQSRGRRQPSQNTLNYRKGAASQNKSKEFKELFHRTMVWSKEYTGKVFSYKVYDGIGLGIWFAYNVPIVEVNLLDMRISKVMIPDKEMIEVHPTILNRTRMLLRHLGIKALRYKNTTLVHTGVSGRSMKPGEHWDVHRSLVKSYVAEVTRVEIQLTLDLSGHSSEIEKAGERLFDWDYIDIYGNTIHAATVYEENGTVRGTCPLNRVGKLPKLGTTSVNPKPI
jgi:hypothetical protein